MEEISNIDKFGDDESTFDYSGDITLPKELESAPDEIKQYYSEWLKIGNELKNDKRRYFRFINKTSSKAHTIDLLGLPGKIQNMAKEKGISDDDFEVLDVMAQEFQQRKILKTKLAWKWKGWLKPHLGRSVFDWRKAEIIEMFSRYMSYDEVKETIEKEGYTVNLTELYKFFINNRDVINKKRLDFMRSSRDYFIATDAGRMETLASLHAKFTKMFDDLYRGDIKLSTSQRNELRQLSSEIRAIIEQARKEVKGDEIRLTVDGKIDITATLQVNQTITEISKKIPLHIIPVYLVAVKARMDPNMLIGSLISGFYKDYNGFAPLTGEGRPPITNDIIRNYNWDEIQRFHKEKAERAQEAKADVYTEYEELPFAKQTQAKTKREKLMDMLNQNKDNHGG